MQVVYTFFKQIWNWAQLVYHFGTTGFRPPLSLYAYFIGLKENLCINLIKTVRKKGLTWPAMKNTARWTMALGMGGKVVNLSESFYKETVPWRCGKPINVTQKPRKIYCYDNRSINAGFLSISKTFVQSINLIVQSCFWSKLFLAKMLKKVREKLTVNIYNSVQNYLPLL